MLWSIQKFGVFSGAEIVKIMEAPVSLVRAKRGAT
jgi:hypothetical protein